MKKLYRSTLIAGLVAFGVAACGDDVQVVEPTPPPPPPLQVSMTPANLNLNVGESANLALSISGGAEGAETNWTCTSSNPDVATTSPSATGCSVTGAGQGNATITAEVTRGTQTATAAAAIAVGELERATVSIASMPPSPLSDTVSITVNVDPKDETPTLLELVFIDEDGQESVMDAQVFSSAPEAAAAADDDPEAAVQQITFNVNTLEGEVDEETGLFHPALINGDYIVMARLFTVQSGETAPSAQQTRTTRVENDNHAIIQHRSDLSQAAGARTAVEPGAGVRYWGGGDLVFQVIPRLYSGQKAGQVNVTIASNAGGTTATPDATQLNEGPYLFTIEYDHEDNFGEVEDLPNVGDGHTITVDQVRDVEGGLTGVSGQSVTLRIDMTPPTLDPNSEIVIDNDPAVAPDGSGDQYFSSGSLRLNPAADDLGVGVSPTAGYSFLALFEEEELEDPVSSIGEDVFTEAGDLQWQVAVNWIEDRVGNRVLVEDIEANVDGEGVSEPFNVDKSAPEFSNVLPESDETFIFSGGGGVLFTALDPELADGSDGSGVDAAGVEVHLLNVDEDDDAEFDAADIDDLGDGDFSFDIQDNNVGDGLYELTMIAPDMAIVPNVGEAGVTFILDTTPPVVDLTDTPSNRATAAQSSLFTIAGIISDLNGVDAEQSRIEIRLPANNDPAASTCGTVATQGDLYTDDFEDLIDADEAEIGEEFSETFRAFNPDTGGAEVTYRYCIWVIGVDVALDNEGNADGNTAHVLTQFDITWNPNGGAGTPTPDQLTIISGNGQALEFGETSDPLEVEVLDQFGVEMENVTVSFSGSGVAHTLSAASDETDVDGLASITVDAQNEEGTIEVEASVNGLTETFTLTVFDPNFSFGAPGPTPRDMAFDGTDLWVTTENDVDPSETDIHRVSVVDGTVLQTFAAPAGSHRGLTWGDGSLWYASSDTDRIYRLNPADGTVQNDFATPGSSPRGLAWDGSTLWHNDATGATGTIYQLDPTDGTELDDFASPADAPTGLTWDGTHLWSARSDGAQNIIRVDPATGLEVDSIDNPSTFPLGLAFDGSGPWLWVSDQTEEEIYRIRLDL
jgi:hypothetical protein